MRFELFIAARYLRARRRQAVVGVITAISVIGVAAGVASLTLALAITNGMRRDLQDRLLGSTAHVELMRTFGDGMRDWRPLLASLRTQPHVTAAAPGLYGQVLISRGARSGGALVKGIVPADERTVSDLLQTVKDGSADSLNEKGPLDMQDPIVIGGDLAQSIGAEVGDTVLVTSPQGELTPLGLIPRYQRFTVTGIFESGFYQYDSGYAFLRLTDAQRLFSEPDLISVISFKVDDLYHADSIGRQIEAAAGPGYQSTNWMEQNRELFRALKLEQVVTFIVIALIVCVAALNILIALTMMVMEKTRDIAVLMSFGVRAEQIRRIFLFQGLLISVLGTCLGMVIGFGAAWAGGHYRFIHLDASVYSIDYLPFAPRLVDSLIVAGVSLGVSLLATLYPSSSAARVLPAEALRYE
ncbi:MAG TPA: ABC transporter permease [Acidobacteriaceae bacterium]|nr:ABC transporter permease [Acidobacteriaceae bacterium]